MPDPARAFSQYSTTRPELTAKNDIAHVADAGRAAIARDQQNIINTTDGSDPQHYDGDSSNWRTSANAGGYANT